MPKSKGQGRGQGQDPQGQGLDPRGQGQGLDPRGQGQGQGPEPSRPRLRTQICALEDYITVSQMFPTFLFYSRYQSSIFIFLSTSFQ